MSCLSIIQNVCKRMIPSNVPTAVVSSTDPQVIQLLALLNEEGQTLADRVTWQALTQVATFTTVATESQGALSTIAPACKFIVNDTIWNQTLRRPVFGPLSPQFYEQQKAMVMQGPWNQFRILGGQIRFIPSPAADQTCVFEYVTTNWATDSTGATGKSAFTADTDVSLLDEQLLELGLIWRWREAKGLDFTTQYQKYEARVIDAIARDGSKPVLDMGGDSYDILPIVYIPSGSWGV